MKAESNLKYKKIRVLSKEHSMAIQDAAFKLGFKWDTLHSKIPTALDSKYLYLCDNFYIEHGCRDDSFEREPKQEIFFYNGKFQSEPEENNADIVEPIKFDNGFYYGQKIYASDEECLYLSPLMNTDESVVKLNVGGVMVVDNSEIKTEDQHIKELSLVKAKALFITWCRNLGVDHGETRWDKHEENEKIEWLNFYNEVEATIKSDGLDVEKRASLLYEAYKSQLQKFIQDLMGDFDTLTDIAKQPWIAMAEKCLFVDDSRPF